MVTCRVRKVPRAVYCAWRDRVPSARAVVDEALTTTFRQVHLESRDTYGARRVHAELRLGLGVRVGRKRVARLVRTVDLQGVCHRRRRRGGKPAPPPHEDLVKRAFRADGPDRLWFSDITQHRAKDGWVYCAAVIDAYSRRVVGWSISDRITSEIVVDALEMARWQRRPAAGTVEHADLAAQYTSWVLGHRLRRAGMLGSMRRVASSVDNALIESIWSTMQRELLNRHDWESRTELASAMFEWIEGFYSPADATPRSATSAPSSSKQFTTVSPLRHDRHTTGVHGNGSGSARFRATLSTTSLNSFGNAFGTSNIHPTVTFVTAGQESPQPSAVPYAG